MVRCLGILAIRWRFALLLWPGQQLVRSRSCAIHPTVRAQGLYLELPVIYIRFTSQGVRIHHGHHPVLSIVPFSEEAGHDIPVPIGEEHK